MVDIQELFGKHFNGLHYDDITAERIMKFAEDYARNVLEDVISDNIAPLEDEIKQYKVDYCNALSWVGREAAKENIRENEKSIQLLKELL
jgi:hypothetical protein